DRQPQKRNEPDHTAASYAGAEGSRPRPHRIVRAVRIDRAVARERPVAAGSRAPLVTAGARAARWPLGVHPVLLLLDFVSELLVEPGSLSRPVNSIAVLPLARRQPRPAHRRTPRPPGGPVPALPLPHDHELHQRLPERTQPGARDRQYQANDGRARVRTRP